MKKNGLENGEDDSLKPPFNIEQFRAKVLALSQRRRLFVPGSKVVVAVSGGQDSCALLHVLCSLRKELQIEPAAAHFNHGFRIKESEEEEHFVRSLASALEVECVVGRENVPALARLLHLSAQEAARKARFDFFEQVVKEHQASAIALGHTRDDRIETILIHLLRGTGPDGLEGIAPISGCRVRPLLDTSREDTAAYCKSMGITYKEDSSNQSAKYLRNRIRHQLIPLLNGIFGQEYRESLLRLSDIASSESAWIQEYADDLVDRIAIRTDEFVEYPASKISSLPEALRRRVLRRIIGKERGHLDDITFEHVDHLLAAISNGSSSFSETLPGGSEILRLKDGMVRYYMEEYPSSAAHFEVVLEAPGEVQLAEHGMKLHACFGVSPEARKLEARGNSVWIDAEQMDFPLIIRNRRSGDRFQPIGMDVPLRLQDYFVNQKVPYHLRDRIPLVTDSKGIVWVAGYSPDSRVRIHPGTKKALHLSISERISE
jgi:tRNA(Ile)-lysidine synthase